MGVSARYPLFGLPEHNQGCFWHLFLHILDQEEELNI
jgi:hypothetical protein